MHQQSKKNQKILALIQKAHRYHQQGKVAKAHEVFSKVLKDQPDNFDALQGIGAVMLGKNQPQEAIKYLVRALDVHPKIPGLQCNLGLAYRNVGNTDEAIQCFEKAIQLDPKFGAAYFNLALSYLDSGNLTQSLHYLQHAEQCRPGHFETLTMSASVLTRLGRYDEATSYYQSALTIEPHDASLHYKLGMVYQSKRLFDEAAAAYLKALELKANYDEAKAKLADVYESTAQLELARNQVVDVLESTPKHPLASLILARLDRRQNNFKSAKNILLNLDEDMTDIGAAIQAELGLILDRLKEYDAAYSAFDKSNAIIGRLIESKHIDQNAAYEAIKKYSQWRADIKSPPVISSFDDHLPSPVFLVGFPRSGTTLTEQVIATGENVLTGDEFSALNDTVININKILGRELLFPAGLDALDGEDLEKLRNFYWGQLTSQLGDKVLESNFIDKMPLNIIHLALIEKIFPSSKIIVSLRDPRDVCLSCFMQFFQMNESMIQFLNLESTTRYYAAVMDYWIKFREKTALQWMETRYEDLVTNFEATAKGLIDFLGIAPACNAQEFYKQASNKTISTPSYQDVSTPIYQRAKGRWVNYESHLAEHQSTLDPYIKIFGYG